MTTTNTLHLAIGRCDYISGINARSIIILSFNTDTGDAKKIGSIETGPNPSWITVDHVAKLIYCTGENAPHGSIQCYPYPKIVTDDGYIDDGDDEQDNMACCDAHNHVETSGASCHIALLDDDTLCCTNYAGGDVVILRRRRHRRHHPSTPDEHLSHYIVEGGRLPSNPTFRNDRQESSHPHHATPLVLNDDDGLKQQHVVAVADLGRDVVSLLDYKSGRWVKHFDTGEGTGPRRALLHGDYLYIMNELNNTISVISPHDNKRGIFLQKNIPLLENPSSSLRRHHRGGSEIAISPCGTYLIAATRSTNEFVVFRISSTDGRLHYVDRVGSVGTTPRHVTFVGERWFLAACHLVQGGLYGEGEVQRSDCVVVFEFDGGVLRFVREIPCPFATCVAVL